VRLLSDAEQARIAAAVTAAEATTSGEIVVAVTPASPQSRLVPALAAVLIGLLVPGVLWATGLLRSFPWLYAAQFATLAVLLPLFLWPPVARWVVPRRLQAERAEEFAREQFHALGLHRTTQRTGVMIFVSLAEHHAELLADSGIAAQVPETAWRDIVAALVTAIRHDRLADGLVEAVQGCGALLARHFPCEAEPRNQIPDRFVQL
jgi:putative membrane protein